MTISEQQVRDAFGGDYTEAAARVFIECFGDAISAVASERGLRAKEVLGEFVRFLTSPVAPETRVFDGL